MLADNIPKQLCSSAKIKYKFYILPLLYFKRGQAVCAYNLTISSSFSSSVFTSTFAKVTTGSKYLSGDEGVSSCS